MQGSGKLYYDFDKQPVVQGVRWIYSDVSIYCGLCIQRFVSFCTDDHCGNDEILVAILVAVFLEIFIAIFVAIFVVIFGVIFGEFI